MLYIEKLLEKRYKSGWYYQRSKHHRNQEQSGQKKGKKHGEKIKQVWKKQCHNALHDIGPFAINID